jgi:hypothetical protein
MSFLKLLNREGVQERYTSTQNSFGEEDKTWNVINALLKCRVQKRTMNEKNSLLEKGGVGEYVVADYTIYALEDEDIIDRDRITVDSKQYEVIKAVKDSSQHHWELKCKIVD